MSVCRFVFAALVLTCSLTGIARGQGTVAPSDLERCEAERLRLSQTIVDLRKTTAPPPESEAKLQQCLGRMDDQERVNRAMIASEDTLREKVGSLEKQLANFKKTAGELGRMEQKLAAAIARGDKLAGDLENARTGLAKAEPRAALADRLEKDVAIYKSHSSKLEVDLAAAQAEVEKLRARLDRYDIPLESGFAYHADNAFDSFLTSVDIPGDLRFPPLEKSRCLAALDWLENQNGDDAPVLKAVWVQENGEWQVCTRAGTVADLRRAAPGVEAHLVFFR